MRLQHWPALLDEYVQERRDTPFSWGTNDCITFAAEWIRRARGEAIFEAEHTDVHSAAHALAERGGMQAAITAVLGEPLEFPMSAQRGDIGLVEIEGRVSAVVVIGALVVGPGESGLHAASLTALTAAWRV